MKFILLSALVAVALAQPIELSEQELGQWESFKVNYLKEYATPEEEAKRMKIFAGHLKFIREHNARYENGEETFTVGINKFADLTNEEFRAQMNGFRMPAKRTGMAFNLTSTGKNAATVDWRKQGAVTDIKNQESCGSCWAFSTTGSLEGQHFLKTKKLVSLSEQNLVDCSKNGNKGCNGGTMDVAFSYIQSNKGIDTEASYPYTGEDGSCHYKKKNVGATVTGYVDITEGSEADLETAVQKVGPVSVAIDASSDAFQLYASGIYGPSDCSSVELDHGVLAIGYGVQGKKKYWLVKNSWGTDWGMSGYFMLAKDKNNKCGVATMASYPTV